jgi:hypothetical protein
MISQVSFPLLRSFDVSVVQDYMLFTFSLNPGVGRQERLPPLPPQSKSHQSDPLIWTAKIDFPSNNKAQLELFSVYFPDFFFHSRICRGVKARCEARLLDTVFLGPSGRAEGGDWLFTSTHGAVACKRPDQVLSKVNGAPVHRCNVKVLAGAFRRRAFRPWPPPFPLPKVTRAKVADRFARFAMVNPLNTDGFVARLLPDSAQTVLSPPSIFPPFNTRRCPPHFLRRAH